MHETKPQDSKDHRQERPFGLWDSPIGPSVIAQGIGLEDVQWDLQSGRIVWLEKRGGRGVLVALDPDGEAPNDLTADLDVRAQVGYGGGAFTVAGGHVYFVTRHGRLYRQSLDGGLPKALTPEFGYPASPAVSPDGRWVVYVHSDGHNDCLAVVDSTGRQWPQKLVQGADFYMQPCWHPDGRRLAFVSWNHPNMPWDGTTLHIAELEETGGSLRAVQVHTIAGGQSTSIFQPAFSPDGRWLAYVSDETGWWQIYLYDLETGAHRQVTGVPAEHGRPAWVQGLRTYGWSPDARALYYVRNEAGFHSLWRFDLESGAHTKLKGNEDGYAVFEQISVGPLGPAAHPRGGAGVSTVQLACIASGPRIPPRVVRLQVPGAAAGHHAGVQVVRRSMAETLPPEMLSEGRPIQWTAPDGATVHGLYYPPANPRFKSSGRPPAVIHIHGGPTSQALPGFDARAQFFTSRGYAYVAVNYRGSTGYGRAYRDALRGQWGVLDVEDAVGAGRYLAEAGLADGERLVIMGASAGGYTVLQALIRYPGFFRAALCMFGVANLFTLAAETHRFEAHYQDSLVGPLPEAAAVYRERSPVFHADRIQDPIAIFHGTDDKVVPKEQSDAIVAALRARGVPHEYHVYEGEGHGWRKPETIAAFWRAVEAFLRRYVIFA